MSTALQSANREASEIVASRHGAVISRVSSEVSSQRAWFSPCGTYRYGLRRVWGPYKETGWLCAFVMLNPSTADENVDDPTIRRCIGFAKAWGFSGLHVANLFALRSTDPKALRKHRDPVGPANDSMIRGLASDCDDVICAWGAHGKLNGRAERVLTLLRGMRVSHLGLTKAGQPRHPLYLPKSTERVRLYQPGKSEET